MSITRRHWTDSSGTPTTGTPLDDAELQTVYDTLDARWYRLSTTLTGSQNDLVITASSLEADLILCNNATDLTITGIAAPTNPAKPGKKLVIVSGGAGNVYLKHQSASSNAANRLINLATSLDTPLAAGVGVAIYVYDDANSRWRLIAHDQGAAITYTPTWTNGTLGNGTLSANYLLRGRTVSVRFSLTWGSTTSSSGVWSFSLPGTGVAGTPFAGAFNAFSQDASAGGTVYPSLGFMNSTTTLQFMSLDAVPATQIATTAPFTWATSDVLNAAGQYQVT